MTKTYVAVTDSGRARLFSLERSETPTRLGPLCELTNRGRRERPSEQFSEPRPGLRHAQHGGPRHGVDDKRDAHLGEHERRFAQEIVDTVQRYRSSGELERLVLTASPSFLGVLRPVLSPLERDGVEIDVLDRDLTGMSPAAIHDHLAAQGLLPARGRVA